MDHNPDEISVYLVKEANGSRLPPADRARALALAGERLKTAASDDAVERLAEELVELARRHAPTSRSEVCAFLGKVGTGLDIAAIEIEGVIHNDTRLTNRASTRLLRGEDHDVSGISSEGARPFVDVMLEEIAAIDDVAGRTAAANALLRSLGALPLNTTLGCDEMFTGLVQRLHPLIDAQAIDPVAKARSAAIMQAIIKGGI